MYCPVYTYLPTNYNIVNYAFSCYNHNKCNNFESVISISKSQSQIPYFVKYQGKLKIVNQDKPGWLTW